MEHNSFFALVFRQKYIKRWGLMRNVTTESLSEHANETAVLAHALAVIGNRIFGKSYDEGHTVLLALYHDLPEVYTGDLPTPVKYFDSSSKASYDKVEKRAISSLLQKMPEELRPTYTEILGEPECPEKQLVKAADKLCAYIKCLEEEKCGNYEFKSAAISLKEKLDAIDLPELRWFCEKILPSFSLTLDEMQM